jgi:Chaperone of endosialidase
MYLKRKDLKRKFNPPSTATPSGQDFSELIDASLNRREDSFYGEWKKDTPYYRGSVVYFQKAFYVLEGAVAEPYCVVTDPNEDPNWSTVGDGKDDDWFIVNKTKMYANVNVKNVGIGGIKEPKAMLHIRAEKSGEFLFEPNTGDPSFTIVNLDDSCPENYMTLKTRAKSANLQTDAPKGFFFTKESLKEKTGPNEKFPTKPVTALAVSIAPSDDPRVGIGTEEPTVHLEVKKAGKGTVKIDGGENAPPSVSIENLDKTCDSNYLKLTLGKTEAAFVTDAKGGFQFKQSNEKADKTQTLVTIADNGNVGIATITPTAPLHIASEAEGDGAIKAGYCQTYPIVQLVNFKRGYDEAKSPNYSVLGTDNDNAVWMTDSTKGFVFKKGNPLSTVESLVNIKEGKELVRIFDDGKVAIGTLANGTTLPKDAYELDVAGATRACGFYIETDRRKIDTSTPLDTVLDDICALKPIRFTWNSSVKCTADGKEFGFYADEVDNIFPEVVKTGVTGDCTQSIAYQNLVPVLVKAIQEQQGQINSLCDDLSALKKQVAELINNK